MSARSTREESRARILARFSAELDRLIPADEGVPLKGSRFSDFEDQVEVLARAALPAILEERAKLEANARVEQPGRCPHCGSLRVYLEKQETSAPMLSLHGALAVHRQQARCRACGGSFSPSGA
jgi:DNA-directed RNA polymerase subunit RPC12/RpoP